MAQRDDRTLRRASPTKAFEPEGKGNPDAPSRRRFLRSGALTAAGLLSGIEWIQAAPVPGDLAGGSFLKLLPFLDEGSAPVNAPIADELDGRFYTDLTRISATRTITPAEEFFVRSRSSRLLPSPVGWKVSVDGLVAQPSSIDMKMLRTSSKPMGVHLMECAGNVRQTRFGLISVASWSGIPITELFSQFRIRPEATAVEIAGFDEYAAPAQTSVPGASWIFPIDTLKQTGAFLATAMNSQPLTRDHGAPVRLVVPGWYGCSCIKWVNRISFVDDSADCTSQMREYAVRTLQEGAPQLAREYQPATVDHAAIPVRVEKWKIAGKIKYRITGILWGGQELVKKLAIRFNPGGEFVNIEGFHQQKNDSWTVWTHTWSPAAPGAYQIRLSIADPVVRTRKMDLGLYDRLVDIDEI